jgi:hypothetical protein
MSTLGVALLVGGAAVFVSGLIFLLPVRRKRSVQREAFNESIEKIDYHLREMRRQRGDQS